MPIESETISASASQISNFSKKSAISLNLRSKIIQRFRNVNNKGEEKFKHPDKTSDSSVINTQIQKKQEEKKMKSRFVIPDFFTISSNLSNVSAKKDDKTSVKEKEKGRKSIAQKDMSNEKKAMSKENQNAPKTTRSKTSTGLPQSKIPDTLKKYVWDNKSSYLRKEFTLNGRKTPKKSSTSASGGESPKIGRSRNTNYQFVNFKKSASVEPNYEKMKMGRKAVSDLRPRTSSEKSPTKIPLSRQESTNRSFRATSQLSGNYENMPKTKKFPEYHRRISSIDNKDNDTSNASQIPTDPYFCKTKTELVKIIRKLEKQIKEKDLILNEKLELIDELSGLQNDKNHLEKINHQYKEQAIITSGRLNDMRNDYSELQSKYKEKSYAVKKLKEIQKQKDREIQDYEEAVYFLRMARPDVTRRTKSNDRQLSLVPQPSRYYNYERDNHPKNINQSDFSKKKKVTRSLKTEITEQLLLENSSEVEREMRANHSGLPSARENIHSSNNNYPNHRHLNYEEPWNLRNVSPYGLRPKRKTDSIERSQTFEYDLSRNNANYSMSKLKEDFDRDNDDLNLNDGMSETTTREDQISLGLTAKQKITRDVRFAKPSEDSDYNDRGPSPGDHATSREMLHEGDLKYQMTDSNRLLDNIFGVSNLKKTNDTSTDRNTNTQHKHLLPPPPIHINESQNNDDLMNRNFSSPARDYDAHQPRLKNHNSYGGTQRDSLASNQPEYESHTDYRRYFNENADNYGAYQNPNPNHRGIGTQSSIGFRNPIPNNTSQSMTSHHRRRSQNPKTYHDNQGRQSLYPTFDRPNNYPRSRPTSALPSYRNNEISNYSDVPRNFSNLTRHRNFNDGLNFPENDYVSHRLPLRPRNNDLSYSRNGENNRVDML